jgi:hypothetical protein
MNRLPQYPVYAHIPGQTPEAPGDENRFRFALEATGNYHADIRNDRDAEEEIRKIAERQQRERRGGPLYGTTIYMLHPCSYSPDDIQSANHDYFAITTFSCSPLISAKGAPEVVHHYYKIDQSGITACRKNEPFLSQIVQEGLDQSNVLPGVLSALDTIRGLDAKRAADIYAEGQPGMPIQLAAQIEDNVPPQLIRPRIANHRHLAIEDGRENPRQEQSYCSRLMSQLFAR